jgi:hypothetical protein
MYGGSDCIASIAILRRVEYGNAQRAKHLFQLLDQVYWPSLSIGGPGAVADAHEIAEDGVIVARIKLLLLENGIVGCE